MNELKPFDFCIKFEFNDYEPKCLNRYKATITADHKANNPEIEFKTSKYEYNKYVLDLEQPDAKEINEEKHTDEKQEKTENTQISNEDSNKASDEDNNKILKSDQHNNENNTLGTIYVPKMLEAGTYAITKAKTPAEEKETIGDLLATIMDRTAAACVVSTILFIFYVLFRLVCDFITSLF